MRYFVKPHYSEWREVDRKKYEKFREFLFKNIITTTDEAKKKEIISRRTRIEQ